MTLHEAIKTSKTYIKRPKHGEDCIYLGQHDLFYWKSNNKPVVFSQASLLATDWEEVKFEQAPAPARTVIEFPRQKIQPIPERLGWFR